MIDCTGSLPKIANNTPPKNIVAKTAKTGVANAYVRLGCGRFSSRIMWFLPASFDQKYSPRRV
jgi:hypothetical protein